MLHRITETVVRYQLSDLERWKRGDKNEWLDGEEPPREVTTTQKEYFFGEYYVASYFRRTGWNALVFFAVGDWKTKQKKYNDGRMQVERSFTYRQLAEFRRARSAPEFSGGAGEPDLFLYMNDGPRLFLEVKKESDGVGKHQLTCLAHIRRFLEADVGIVYLAPYGMQYHPKSYDLDLESFVGHRVDT